MNLKNIFILLFLLGVSACSGKNIFGVEEEKEEILGKRIDAIESLEDLSITDFNITTHIAPPKSVVASRFSNGALNFGPENISINPKYNPKIISLAATSNTKQNFIIIENYLFVLDRNSHLIAYKNDDLSKIIWKQKIPANGKNINENKGGISFDNGTIYVTNGSSQISAVSAFDGRIIWTSTIEGELFKSMPFVYQGKVIVLSIYNKSYALDIDNGDTIWMHQSVPESAIVTIYPAPFAFGNIALIPYSSGLLSAVDVTTGSNIWDVNLASKATNNFFAANNIATTPIVYNNIVFVAGNMGTLFAIDIRNGSVIWYKEIQGVNSIWANGNFIYLINGNGKLIAIHMFDGVIKWVTKITESKEDENFTGPIMVDSKLLVISNKGLLSYYDPNNGHLINSEKIKPKINTMPQFSADNMFVMSNSGYLMVY